jgi:hypothetical protein
LAGLAWSTFSWNDDDALHALGVQRIVNAFLSVAAMGSHGARAAVSCGRTRSVAGVSWGRVRRVALVNTRFTT